MFDEVEVSMNEFYEALGNRADVSSEVIRMGRQVIVRHINEYGTTLGVKREVPEGELSPSLTKWRYYLTK